MKLFDHKKFIRTLYLALERFLVPAISDVTPVKTGHTAASWEINIDGDDFILENKNGQVARYLDEGTGIYGPNKKKIIIRPKTKKALRFKFNGKTIFAKKVEMDGFAGRHYIKSVLENQKLWDKIHKFIEKQMSIELK